MIILVDIIKKLIKYLGGNMENHKDINYYLDNYNIKPYSEAIRITVLYGIAGALWILLSDELLSKLVPNIETFKKFATYKGWVYVLVTMILIYSLVLRRLLLFEKAIEEILNNIQELNASNEELNASNEELMALEEELREQYYELEKNRNALSISEQRYELAVEGADCGIWDWDVENHVYYFSDKWKNYLGYEQNEINNTFDAFINLIHFRERDHVLKKLKDYISSQIGSYEDVFRMECKDGSYKDVELTAVNLIHDPSIKGLLMNYHDITERKKRENELIYISYHDVQTGLYNRDFFEEEIKRLDTERQLPLSVIIGDVNGLKLANDRLGHNQGDMLLVEIANILKICCRDEDIVARIGGDEFCILLPQTSSEVAQTICNRIYKACEDFNRGLDKEMLNPSISLGHATKTNASELIENILKEADNTMYQDKFLRSKKASVFP